MSIKSFISAAKMLYAESFYEEALCLTCSAIDACSALAYPDKGVTNRYKLFLKTHFRIISEIGFPGISASGIKIKVNANIPELKVDRDGFVNMEQIIYHVVRCGLVHSCNINTSVVFTEQTIIGDWNADKFYLPKDLIWGLIAAVEENL